ncbi:MAG: diaminopimelate epimerase [Dactylosporangium sp.]|nr:diaminopimelate epimerase [Dactylosporangium sp.]NNJ62780.1 diaminopimelate epimerase [Dactylosporangium sp.]
MDGWSFAKGHGTGNDFVVLPDPAGSLPLTSTLVAALCDRRRGIGADGVLRAVRTAAHPETRALGGAAEWFMDYWNSDGSLAEICGNGLRVFARYLVDSGMASGDSFQVATRAGIVPVVVHHEAVAVEIGVPRIYATSTVTVADRHFVGAVVDVGNPHLVCVVDDATLSGLRLAEPPVADAVVFPDGVNVEFAAGAPAPPGADLYQRMRVYERGSGETLSCGSGAVAVAAVALRDAGIPDGVVVIDLPGGRLTVTGDESTCWLSGPAVIVAGGVLDPSAIGGLSADRTGAPAPLAGA